MEEAAKIDSQEQVESEQISEGNTTKVNQIVKEHTLYSMGSGIVPIPFVGLISVMGVQLHMINELCKAYDVEFNKTTAKNVLISLIGSILPVAVAMPVASLIKFIPIIGQSAGGVALSSLSSAATYTVGHYLIKHFDSEGTLDNIDAKKAKSELNKMYVKSKGAVKDIKNSFKSKEQDSATA